MNLIEKFGVYSGLRRPANGKATPERIGTLHEDQAAALAESIYTQMLAVMESLEQLQVDDYDLPAISEELILPIAQYLGEDRPSKNGRLEAPGFVKPIIVSGDPGIGKTTLLMVIDEALYRLNLGNTGSCRELLVSGEVQGYFAEKGVLSVTPLRLFDTPTAALSARDWNNVLRHWVYDESTGRQSEQAIDDFMQHLRGKVVIVDEAEMEGYVYFTELLAQHGVLVILSSNLSIDHIRIAPDRIRAVTLRGLDHRKGDIAQVCLRDVPHELFDLFSEREFTSERLLAGTDVSIRNVRGKKVVYLAWDDLQNRPLMKDDFARFFKSVHADFVLLDAVPFFSEITTNDVNLTFLGHLARFVNFVDAIHDCHMPLLVRRTQGDVWDIHASSRNFQAALFAYDARVGGKYGHAAWIEWLRCLSRLRSREDLNARVWLT